MRFTGEDAQGTVWRHRIYRTSWASPGRIRETGC